MTEHRVRNSSLSSSCYCYLNHYDIAFILACTELFMFTFKTQCMEFHIILIVFFAHLPDATQQISRDITLLSTHIKSSDISDISQLSTANKPNLQKPKRRV